MKCTQRSQSWPGDLCPGDRVACWHAVSSVCPILLGRTRALASEAIGSQNLCGISDGNHMTDVL